MSGKVTEAHEQTLHDQVITADRPGSVLRDFGMLLEFLGTDGIEAAGKYNLIAIKSIAELDERLTRPLRLKLKRPQIRSHPYIQGLNLLLRASGLGRVDRTGPKARLVLDPEMRMQWDALNPTERYFNLLEAWLRLGRAEMVKQQGSSRGGLLFPCVQAWQHTPPSGNSYRGRKPREVYLLGIGRDFYLLALMDLFGLLAVELPRGAVTTWAPAGLTHTPFGDAFFNVVSSRIDVLLGNDSILGLEERQGGDEYDEVEPVDEDDEAEDYEGAPEMPSIGAWQPLFQSFFPEWRNNLIFVAPELGGGTRVFKVSLDKVWRRIAMPADATLDDLVSWILDSVHFDHDHLYEFIFRDSLGRTVTAAHPAADGDCASDMLIGKLPLEPGQSMELLYDFGDCWRFTVTLERIEPIGARGKAPSIRERHGRAPEQYPQWDE
jgi:hypothetical protein